MTVIKFVIGDEIGGYWLSFCTRAGQCVHQCWPRGCYHHAAEHVPGRPPQLNCLRQILYYTLQP